MILHKSAGYSFLVIYDWGRGMEQTFVPENSVTTTC